MFVAVEKRGSTVKGVQGVVKGRALFRFFVSSTEEYPLFCCCHLDTDFGVALILQSDGHGVELVAELPEVLVFPAGVVLTEWRVQDGLNVRGILTNQLLNVLLDYTYKEIENYEDIQRS